MSMSTSTPQTLTSRRFQDFYAKMTLSHLAPVLDMLRWLRRETSVWFELTNLIIPGCNDAPDETSELCDWVLANWRRCAPALHRVSSRLQDAHREPTPPGTIHRAREEALIAGLKYAHAGTS